MRPEAPIFFLSEDNRRLDVHRTVEGAEEHLAGGGHLEDDSVARTLLFFDGLARPLDLSSAGKDVRLAVSSPFSDPWQVRARALEAIRRGSDWIAYQGEVVVVGGREVSKEEAEAEMDRLSISYDLSFAEFTQTLVNGFGDVQRHSGSFLHNLFHW
jgi:hypothetical protein